MCRVSCGNFLPPRITRIWGGMIAGNVLPGYDVGGDWLDYVTIMMFAPTAPEQ